MGSLDSWGSILEGGAEEAALCRLRNQPWKELARGGREEVAVVVGEEDRSRNRAWSKTYYPVAAAVAGEVVQKMSLLWECPRLTAFWETEIPDWDGKVQS